LLHDVENVRIVGGTFDFSREDNEAEGGEWGHCITIRSSENVTIVDTTCKNAWGDGINVKRIPGNPDAAQSTNIIVDRYHGQHNRRQGISVLSAKNLWCVNSLIEGTGGTPPGAAIDLEPNNFWHDLHNITIQNLHTIDNKEGIQVTPSSLTREFGQKHSEDPDTVESKAMDITVSNLQSERDTYGIVCNSARGELHGGVRFHSPTIVEPKQGGMSVRDWEDVASRITVEGLRVRDAGGSGIKWGSAVGIFGKANTQAGDYVPGRTSKIGNVELVNPTVTVGPANATAPRALFAKDYGEIGINDITLINPRDMASDGPSVHLTNADGALIEDPSVDTINIVDDHYDALEQF
jgi:hypothetical protein